MNTSLSTQDRHIQKLNHYDVKMSAMDIDDY